MRAKRPAVSRAVLFLCLARLFIWSYSICLPFDDLLPQQQKGEFFVREQIILNNNQFLANSPAPQRLFRTLSLFAKLHSNFRLEENKKQSAKVRHETQKRKRKTTQAKLTAPRPIIFTILVSNERQESDASDSSY